jgi:hypothetical protein
VGIDLVVVGQIVGGQIVISVFARVDGVRAGVQVISAIMPGIGRTSISRQLGVGNPGCGLASGGNSRLDCPMVAQLGGNVDPVLGIAIKRIKEGVTISVVIRSQLSFDIGQRDVSPDADIGSLGYMWDIEVQIVHHRVITVGVVVFQQLLAEDSHGGGVAVVEAVEVGKAEPPIEVVGLNSIG